MECVDHAFTRVAGEPAISINRLKVAAAEARWARWSADQGTGRAFLKIGVLKGSFPSFAVRAFSGSTVDQLSIASGSGPVGRLTFTVVPLDVGATSTKLM